jgi:hypothetical protein
MLNISESFCEEKMRVLFYLALTGLILSIIVHIMTFAGYNEFLNDWQAFVFFLHGGCIFLGLPMVLSLQKTTIGKDRKDYWKIAIENCPNWMKNLIKLCVIYGFLSFFIGEFSTKGGQVSGPPFKQFSSMWIVFILLKPG